jgi:hypothetical protein
MPYDPLKPYADCTGSPWRRLLNLTLLKETNRDLFGGGGKRVAEEAQHHQSSDDHDFEHERNVHHGPGHHGANAV